jgi:hypothetical protein
MLLTVQTWPLKNITIDRGVWPAGRELYTALARVYRDDGALPVINELSAVVDKARAHAGKTERGP